MAIDFQVVQPQEAVPLTRVTLIPGPPRSLDVLGADFRSVDEVLINEVTSPDVVVLNKTRLLAQVPELIQGDRILTVSVLSKRLAATPVSLLRFRIGRSPGKVSGIQRLVQKFLRILFTTPGSDIFNKRLGGGALKNVGGTFGIDEGDDLVQDFIIAVDTTARQVVAIQSRKPSLPRDERLLSARTTHASFNKEALGIDATVEITSQAGEAATANVGL